MLSSDTGWPHKDAHNPICVWGRSVVLENDFVVIVERRKILMNALVISEIEAHVKERVVCPEVDLHLCCRQPVHEPVESIVLSNAVIDEFGFFTVYVWY